jgi:uncharacterized damage-inducible protein DinB
MRRHHRLFCAVLVLLPACAAESQPRPAAVQDDLAATVAIVEDKVVGLAETMPAELYAWRPGESVRSAGEVFMHIAAENYYLAALLGVTPPAHTGITDDYDTVIAFEARALEKGAIVEELSRSFRFRQSAVTGLPALRLEERVDFFGDEVTVQQLLVMATAHVHEHLGQAIAYARANGIVPPWSQ